MRAFNISPTSFICLLALIIKTSKNVTCDEKPFPKFVGGFIENTFIYQMDVSEATDSISIVGYTYDRGLTPSASSFVPLVGVLSISSPQTIFKWIKYLP